MSVTLYSTSVSSSREIRKRIDRIKNVLEAMSIEFTEIDIADGVEVKETMRELCNDPVALPPQLFKGDEYCGDFEKFEEAVENKNLKTFLKLQ